MHPKQKYWRFVLLATLFAAAVPLGGCRASCESDSDLENAVEDVADDVEDAADEVTD